MLLKMKQYMLSEPPTKQSEIITWLFPCSVNSLIHLIVPDNLSTPGLCPSALLEEVFVSVATRNLFGCGSLYLMMAMECWMVDGREKISAGQQREVVCWGWSSLLIPTEAGQLALV